MLKSTKPKRVTRKEQIPYRASTVQFYLADRKMQTTEILMSASDTWWRSRRSGPAHASAKFAAWPTEAELPPWTAPLALPWPPCCLHGQSRRAGADGTVWGEEKCWAPPFHCNYPIWQSFTHSLLLHSQGWEWIAFVSLDSLFKVVCVNTL